MTATGEPHYELRYSEASKDPKLHGWYFVLVASDGTESHESNIFFNDGVKIGEDPNEDVAPTNEFYGKPRGEALAIQCAREELESKVKAEKVK